ncbi:MAG: nicotinate-nucleotide adenylyltransferase [Sphingopyxis sp.]
MITTGLLGGSFNPAHGGHRAISLQAMAALGLDELWWLVSPGNVLKPKAGMAPLSARLASARIQSRRARIRPTAIEAFLGTRYTIDTLRALVRRYPNRQFIWLMGADNLAQLHLWRDWRAIAQMMPIAIIARPGYDSHARAAVAMGWFRRYVHPVDLKRHWTQWRAPALIFMRFPPDVRSATLARVANPDWPMTMASHLQRDLVMRRFLPKDCI